VQCFQAIRLIENMPKKHVNHVNPNVTHPKEKLPPPEVTEMFIKGKLLLTTTLLFVFWYVLCFKQALDPT